MKNADKGIIVHHIYATSFDLMSIVLLSENIISNAEILCSKKMSLKKYSLVHKTREYFCLFCF